MTRAKTMRCAHWSLVAGLSLAVIYWLVDALLHTSLFHDRDFWAAVLPLQDADEMWVRALISAMFIGFGIVMDAVLARLRRVHQRQGCLVEKLEQSTQALGERVKELRCLYGIDELARTEGTTIEAILEDVAALLPSSLQYPEIALGRIVYEGDAFGAAISQEANWRQTAEIVIDNASVGSVEVCYVEQMPDRDESPFLEEERYLIDSMAVRLAGIIKQKQAEQSLRDSEARFQQLSRMDGLTGLLNRRGWNESLADEERRAQRHGHQTCVMMADVDDLKDTNDRHGHAAGDDLLRRIAECIRVAVRDIDKVARIGGDEFAILFIECDRDTASPVSERIEAAWLAEGIKASWGIAMRNAATGLQGAMAEADRLMYEMKANRRTDPSIAKA